jgi:hypothetical protein
MSNERSSHGLLALAVSCFIAAAAAAPAPAAAQEAPGRSPVLSVSGGMTQYDLSGTGTVPFTALRAQIPVSRHFLVEPGATYMSYRNQGDIQAPRWHVLLPEVQLQAQLPGRTLRPYLGVGAGYSRERLESLTVNDLTAAVAAGLRINLPAGFSAGTELRVRAVDPTHGSMADWGVSIGRHIR